MNYVLLAGAIHLTWQQDAAAAGSSQQVVPLVVCCGRAEQCKTTPNTVTQHDETNYQGCHHQG